jgi:predicted small lipoprotein YifL
MKSLILASLTFSLAACGPTALPVADSQPFNPLDEPGGQGAGTVNFDSYSDQGRFAPNFEQRRAVGLYGH